MPMTSWFVALWHSRKTHPSSFWLFCCVSRTRRVSRNTQHPSIRTRQKRGGYWFMKVGGKGGKKKLPLYPNSWAPRNGGIDDISILHVSRLSSVPLFQPSSFSFWIATLKWWGESDCRGFATSRFLSGRWQRTRHRQNGWGLRENRETSKLWLPPPARYWFINFKKRRRRIRREKLTPMSVGLLVEHEHGIFNL